MCTAEPNVYGALWSIPPNESISCYGPPTTEQPREMGELKLSRTPFHRRAATSNRRAADA